MASCGREGEHVDVSDDTSCEFTRCRGWEQIGACKELKKDSIVCLTVWEAAGCHAGAFSLVACAQQAWCCTPGKAPPLTWMVTFSMMRERSPMMAWLTLHSRR